MKKLTLAALAIIPTLTFTSLPTQDAHACGNSERYDREMTVKLKPASVMQADQHLQKHRWSAAISEAQGVYPELKKLGTSYQSTEDLELKRAAKIVAISIVRLKSQRVSKDNKKLTNKAHLKWASATLTHLHTSTPDDPELTALYAEALALTPSTKPQALSTLNDLHKRDLLPSAYSYALLSKLRTDAKDTTAKDAHYRCMLISSNDKDLCSLNIKAPPAPTPKGLLRSKSAPRSKNLKTAPDSLAL